MFEIPFDISFSGEKGDRGFSAYEVWLKAGNRGTVRDYLKSLKGKDGEDGKNGKDGKDGSDGLKGENGKEGKSGKDGRDGVDGLDGEDGKSAYEIWLEQGNEGTKQEFLDSLKGKDGKNATAPMYHGNALTDITELTRPYIIVSDNYTVKSNDYYVEIDTSGKTSTLPSTAKKGAEVHIDNSSNGLVYVTPIGGLPDTLTLDVNEGSYFVYNGSNWRVK